MQERRRHRLFKGHIYLQERKVNRVAAAALKIVAGRGVCGAAVEVDPGPRRTQQVMTYTAWAIPCPSTSCTQCHVELIFLMLCRIILLGHYK